MTSTKTPEQTEAFERLSYRLQSQIEEAESKRAWKTPVKPDDDGCLPGEAYPGEHARQKEAAVKGFRGPIS